MIDLIYLNDDIEDVVERILSDGELKNCGLGKRKVNKCLKSFQGDELACSVFLKKYALRNEDNEILEFTLDDAKARWANTIAETEYLFDGRRAKPYEYFKELYDYCLPAGRQMYALGNEYVKKATYSNCYVTKIEEDSIEGIFDAAAKLARTYSYGGGIGLCIGELRPAQSKVSNSAKFSTGAVSFMELYSVTTGLIGQHGRRGALMITIPVDHPDVELFIGTKHNNRDKVEFANISIKLTDEFMKAVENDDDFTLSFETYHEKFERKVKARELWKKIIQSARDSDEPGLMFWDRMVEMSPSNVYPRLRIHSTNPCGEQPLEKGGCCCLASLLLHKFVENPFTEGATFNYELFSEMVCRGVRHLDNVVELNIGKHGLKEQEEAAKLGRRIGLGITGLADTLVALGIRYDSEEAAKFVDSLMELKKSKEYLASIDLARERGSFPLFDIKKHFNQGFCAMLGDDIKEAASKHGLRNVALSTVAPSGSLSVVAQCSSGMEPIFALKYFRSVEMGGKKKKFNVFHQGLARWFVAHENDDEDINDDLSNLPDYWVVSHDIDYMARVKLQGIMQKHIDASISSTINLPKDVDIKVVDMIYRSAWKEGLKGVTIYREGSRDGVLVTDEFAKQAGIPAMNSVVHCVHAEGGDKFYIIVSYYNRNISKPYQVFVMNYKRAECDAFVKIGNSLIRMLREQGVPDRRIQKYIDRSSNSLAKLTRFLSLSMKTDNLERALDILDEHAFAGTLAARLHQILSDSATAKKAVCPMCKSANLRMEEGCLRCLDCHWSGCN